jgi:hypothetical protein
VKLHLRNQEKTNFENGSFDIGRIQTNGFQAS